MLNSIWDKKLILIDIKVAKLRNYWVFIFYFVYAALILIITKLVLNLISLALTC